MKVFLPILLLLLPFFSWTQERDTLYTLSIGELLGLKVEIGSRGEAKLQFASLVSVDVISSEEITSTGFTDLGMAIQRLVPYTQYFQPTLMDGADHVFPMSMRGFAADQLLVLVNGKRLTTTAMIFENSRINKGAFAVDLRMIPVNAVDRIEILKEGASAQYGSDAIAGIINIILKDDTSGDVRFINGVTYELDGVSKEIQTSLGKKVGKSSFQIYANYHDRDYTDRAGLDERNQYFDGDPRNTGKPVKNHRYGVAASADFNLAAKGNIKIDEQTSFYSTVLYNNRIGEAPGYFRRPLDNRTVRAIYPDGFLPFIAPSINNLNLNFGIESQIANWYTNISVLHSLNQMDFYVKNSLNTSMGIKSPSSFYCGSLNLNETITNLDFNRTINIKTNGPLVFGVGSEIKIDDYSVLHGDENSYKDGGETVLDGPNAGSPTPAGAQVLPGFTPSNEINRKRQSTAMYLDIENSLTKAFSWGIASRAENYTDFGSTVNGKITLRFEPLKGIAIRGSAGTGFRAPSLAQSYYSSTVTNFIDGVAYENGTFNVEHPISRLLGATPLKPEKSTHYSAGIIAQAIGSIVISTDIYLTYVDNRIFFTGNFTASNAPAFSSLFSSYGVGGARFFTNAVNTKTQGVDINLKHTTKLLDRFTLKSSISANLNRIELNGEPKVPEQVIDYKDVFFDRSEKARITTSIPESRAIVSVHLTGKSSSIKISGLYFGPIKVVHSVAKPETDQVISHGFICDMSVSHSFSNGISLMLGGHNLLNKYPDKSTTIEGDAFTGKVFPYNPFSAYGFYGGSVYLSINYQLSAPKL